MFAPGSRDNLHADKQTRAAFFHFTGGLFYNVA
jgi:hypothetical protein